MKNDQLIQQALQKSEVMFKSYGGSDAAAINNLAGAILLAAVILANKSHDGDGEKS